MLACDVPLSQQSNRQSEEEEDEYHECFLFGNKVRRICRSRKLALRRTDCRVIFFRGADSFPGRRTRTARAERSQRLAQANSIARIASPAGMTRKAGPGSTIRAMPRASTVPPTTATTIVLTCLIVRLSSVHSFSPQC